MAGKAKDEGRKESKKKKTRLLCHFEPKTLISAHALAWQADILHVNQKVAKCTICKQLCGTL